MTNEELLSWINEMPEWVRKATMLYYQNGIITDTDVKVLADSCLSGDNSYKVSSINLINHGNTIGYSISSIDSVEGVNAINTNIPLKFKDKGITVIYGLNGAGKSGYIRIIKMISGAKYREEIKSNIYSAKKTMPKATISVSKEDGSTEQFICDLRKPAQHKLLGTIDIFDTKISNAYVNDAKEATYEPWVFSLLAELANVAVRIKSELESRKKDFSVVPYGFQEKYKATKAYGKIENVSEKTNIDTFSLIWSPEQDAKLQDLRKKNQIEAVKGQLKQIEQADKNLGLLIQYFEALDAYFGDDNWNNLLSLQTEWKEAENAKNALQLLFSENASEYDASSVTVDSWKKLWQYAHKYTEDVLEKKGDIKFVNLGGKCPLCRQTIADKAVADRMESIDSYVNGKVLETERSKFQSFERVVRGLPKLKSVDELTILLDSAGITDNSEGVVLLHNSVIEYANAICESIRDISLRQISVKSYLTSFQRLKTELQEKYESTQKLIDAKAQEALEQQILEAEAEQYLVSIYEVIKSNIEKLREVKKIEQAIKLTATNKITSKSKTLAEEMITSDYVRRFETELQELTKNSIAVKLSQQKAGRGKIPYKVVLCDVNGNQIAPQDILSEGENRVTSLAAFFAEASGRNEVTPLIVDDPISSLDYTYEAKVIDRLVKAAKTRQVIVFTHRISMVVGISDKSKTEGVEYDEVTLLSSKSRKGVPSENSSIGGKVKTQLNVLIEGKLRKLKGMDELEEGYSALFHNVCQEFRNIVEKSVEDVLIAEVVKRFRKDVQTKNRLDKLANITEDDCKLIDRLMTKYSYYDHSMSDETPLLEMEIDELEKDLLELKVWIAKKGK